MDERGCRLVSRKGNEFKSFPDLNKTLPSEITTRFVILDAEIVCIDKSGHSQVQDLLFRRGDARHLLWMTVEDLRHAPLIERKWRVRSILPVQGERLLYCDHVEINGEGLFSLAYEHDLEGIVAKREFHPYLPQHANWLKVRNQGYSQWVGREELFERDRRELLSLFTGTTVLWRSLPPRVNQPTAYPRYSQLAAR